MRMPARPDDKWVINGADPNDVREKQALLEDQALSVNREERLALLTVA